MIEKMAKLFGESSSGKIKQWQISVEALADGTARTTTEAGYVGGKIQITPKMTRKGKNIGKANETTPFDQAVFDAGSKFEKQRNKNYEPDLELFDPRVKGNGLLVGSGYVPRLMLPQLAKGVKKGNIVFPCYMQPKLNGICDLAETMGVHHTRGGKLFDTLEHLNPWIDSLNSYAPLHGELYTHGWSLQKISSYTKKIKEDQQELQFWVYAIADPKRDFKDLWDEFVSIMEHLGPECPIKVTPTVIVNNYEEAKKWHDDWVEQGFEGGMLKNFDGTYVFQFRSGDIEKAKTYFTKEFKIIGGTDGVGRAEGCVTYLCITEEGEEFECVPRGTLEDRHEMYLNLENDIGKMMTVRFAEYSDKGIPLQPTGKPQAEAVRDYE